MTTSTAPLYIGTKTVHATPMTRQAYNDYRSWTLPADENGDDAGFLVEYVDGGKGNDSRHAGYISWSPADVFERSYRPIGTFQDRVRLERDELEAKRAKLAAFIGSDRNCLGISADALGLLIEQHAAQADLIDILDKRIAAFEPAHAVG